MSPLFEKLNIGDHKIVHVLNAPESFETELAALKGLTVRRTISTGTEFALAFVVTQKELDSVSTKLVKAAQGDAVLWLAYPKGTSKKYKCEFNRDSGWDVLRKAGFDSVRMVAIDDDWSALRFRRVANIKTAKKKVGMQST